MSEVELVAGFVGVFFAGLAIGGLRPVVERQRVRRALSRRPVLDDDIVEGAVARATGVVCAVVGTLEAPLSGRACVVVRSRAIPATSNPVWMAMSPLETFAMVRFVLDREGKPPVVIEGERARLDLPAVKLKPPDHIESEEMVRRKRFLASHGEIPKRGAGGRYSETIVAPGDRVTVAGLVMKDPVVAPTEGELGFRDGATPTLRLVGNREHPLVIGRAR